MIDQLAVHPDGGHHLRVESLLQLLAQRLAHQEEAAHLDAAAGAARAGTHEHQQHQHLFCQRGPEVEITAGKAGGGNDGADLEGRMAQCLAEGAVEAADVHRDDGHRRQNDGKIGADFLAGRCAAEPAQQQQEIRVEVDAEEDHKDGHDPLDVGREAGKAVVLEAEAASTRRAKGREQRVEHIHSARQQEAELHHREREIDAVQDLGRRLHLRHQLVHLRAGAFRLHQVDVGAAGQGQQGEQEHQNAHAADPMGEAAPEQDAVGQALHTGQDAGTGGGKARNGLKHGVHGVRDAAGEDERHCAHDTDGDPAQGGGRKALPHIEHLAAGLDGLQGKAQRPTDGRRQQEHAHDGPLGVEEARHRREQQQRALYHQDVAQQTKDDRIIHTSCPPLLFHDVPQVMQAVFQRDDDDVVAHLDLVAAAGDEDVVAAGDAAEQQILFQMQLAQRHAGGPALLMDREFQRFHAVVEDAVKGLDVVAGLVLQGADVLHDVVAGHVLGVDDTAQIEPGQNIVELEAVDLRDQLALGVLFRKQGQQHVFFVDVGQSHEGFGGFQTFREQEVAVGAVLVQDLCLRQGLGQNIAAGRVPLDDADADVIFQQLLTQVIGDGTAAHDEGVAHRPHRHIDTLEELVGLLLRGEEGDLVAVLQHKVTVGDDDPAVTLHRADQNVALEAGGDLVDGHAVQPLPLGQRKLDEPHASAREGIDFACAREPQQVGDFLGRCHFGVDDGRDADLLLDKVQLMAVRRVAHAGDGVAVARLFGEHAAQQVQLVRAGDCDEHVRFLHARLGQGGDGRAVAENAHHIVGLPDMLHTGLVRVDNCHVVTLFTELPRQRCADFAAAHQNDLHRITLSLLLRRLGAIE